LGNLHGDHHGLWIDPDDSDHLLNVNDGGCNESFDGGQTWRDFYRGIQAIQFYNVEFDLNKPFTVYGSVQDSGTHRGLGVAPLSAPPAGQRRFRQARVRWEPAPGGEGTIIAVNPIDPKHRIFIIILRPPDAFGIQKWNLEQQRNISSAARRRAGTPWAVAGPNHPLPPQPGHCLPWLPVCIFARLTEGNLGKNQSGPDRLRPQEAGPASLRHSFCHADGHFRITAEVRGNLRRNRRRPPPCHPGRRDYLDGNYRRTSPQQACLVPRDFQIRTGYCLHRPDWTT